MKPLLFILTLCSLLFTAGRSIAQQPLFRLLPSTSTHIDFSNMLDESEKLNVLSYEYFYNGGGVAVGDINNDGLEDLFFTSNMGENKLYLNMGHMQFKDITSEAGKGLAGKKGGWKTGVTMADVNGDGLIDIYICYSGNTKDSTLRKNQLFINQGNNKFIEMAKEYGLDDAGYGTQAVFFDYDNDGDMDMFLLNHNIIKVSNLQLAGYENQTDKLAGDKLFKNVNGHFTDVSKEAGIHQNPLTFGLGVAIADINQDGWPDIYVTNDYAEPDYCYINNHDGTFTERSKEYFRHLSQFSMGVDIADFNNDGLPDIVTLDMLPEDNRRQKLLQLQENYESFQLLLDQGLYKQYMRNMLQLNNGDGTFSEIGQLAGVSNTDWSWCPLLADFDNDGYKDLFVSNGYLRDYTNLDFLQYWGDFKIKKQMDSLPLRMMDLVKAMPVTKYPNYIFRNNHDLTFTNKFREWGLDQAKISSGAVYADLDNDGDLDLVVNNLDQPAFIYQNMSRENEHSSYLEIRLKGLARNTAAIGAKIYLYSSGQIQYEEVNPTRGYLSCSTTTAHFGLGISSQGIQKPVDSVRIIWPDQRTRLLKAVAPDQLLLVAETLADPPYLKPVNKVSPVFKKVVSPIAYTNEEFTENDFKRQQLMLFMYSKTSPVMATGDINKDGLQDLFISGDKNQPGRIFTQQAGGSFAAGTDKIGNEITSAISAAAFFDVNGDGYDDLYVAKGGYSYWEPGKKELQDDIYLNDGHGNFSLSAGRLPDLSANSKSCVRPCDYNLDGSMDVFIGGRIIPGSYPSAPRSYLLKNDGKGNFTEVSTPFDSIGMVTDARWVDLDNDGRKDLVICGEFMPITVFLNTPGGFINVTARYFEKPAYGFWNCLTIADLNGDGKPDILAGNLSLNSQIKVSEKEPAELFYADFDDNGSIDPFFNFYIQGKSYPFVSRNELNNQIYAMRLKFRSYKNYSTATMQDIFSPAELSKAGKLMATQAKTTCFLNTDGKFTESPLPLEAQFSMVSSILVDDFNKDGKPDILLLGNHSDNRLKLGSMDAGYGCLLEGDGKGGFTYIPQPVSGLSVKGDVKSALPLKIGDRNYIAIGVSNQPLQLYLRP